MERRLLVVEDNPPTIDLIKYLITGFEIDSASTYSEALEKLSENEYCAILIDIKLPDFTGTYLAEQIRKEKNIPIAFLSNYDTNATKEVADEVRADIWMKSDVLVDMKLQEKVNILSGVCLA